MNEITQCKASATDGATLADIPDVELREEVRSKLLEIILAYYDSDIVDAQTIASRLDSFPLSEISSFIGYANTPEYMEKYADVLFSGLATSFLDLEILALGRPAGSLEYVFSLFVIVVAKV